MSETEKTGTAVDTESIVTVTKDNNSDNKKPKYKISQVMLIIRIIISGYILYIVKELVDGYIAGDGLPFPALIAVSLIFGMCGVIIGVKSLIALIKGEFAGGKADV